MKKLVLVFVALFAVAAFAETPVTTVPQAQPAAEQVNAPANQAEAAPSVQATVEQKKAKAKKHHKHVSAPVAAPAAAAPAPAAK